jgi:hypothetical protein
MPTTLSTKLSKIEYLPNAINATQFHQYMVSNGASERHQNNSLKMVIAFAIYLGPTITFYDLERPEQIIPFLDTKIKRADLDPEFNSNKQ